MTITIKQLTVNSSIKSDKASENECAENEMLESSSYTSLEELKSDIISECRKIVKYGIESMRER